MQLSGQRYISLPDAFDLRWSPWRFWPGPTNCGNHVLAAQMTGSRSAAVIVAPRALPDLAARASEASTSLRQLPL